MHFFIILSHFLGFILWFGRHFWALVRNILCSHFTLGPHFLKVERLRVEFIAFPEVVTRPQNSVWSLSLKSRHLCECVQVKLLARVLQLDSFDYDRLRLNWLHQTIFDAHAILQLAVEVVEEFVCFDIGRCLKHKSCLFDIWDVRIDMIAFLWLHKMTQALR